MWSRSDQSCPDACNIPFTSINQDNGYNCIDVGSILGPGAFICECPGDLAPGELNAPCRICNNVTNICGPNPALHRCTEGDFGPLPTDKFACFCRSSTSDRFISTIPEQRCG
ncbi:unnamed protein product [Didymodactylos carnosus]|uniref:Uncharacterized protein n=1 Tax=Didymodactylos carnosus TaxID=1234261 RepID=A0A814QCV4_9BILA|nr:unnamed protein product [Didymodactylos carnosus]CAF3881569.1 unnamed protein product [Didymodactylos carnosus]